MSQVTTTPPTTQVTTTPPTTQVTTTSSTKKDWMSHFSNLSPVLKFFLYIIFAIIIISTLIDFFWIMYFMSSTRRAAPDPETWWKKLSKNEKRFWIACWIIGGPGAIIIALVAVSKMPYYY